MSKKLNEQLTVEVDANYTAYFYLYRKQGMYCYNWLNLPAVYLGFLGPNGRRTLSKTKLTADQLKAWVIQLKADFKRFTEEI